MTMPMIGKKIMHTEKHSCNNIPQIAPLALVYPTYSPFTDLRQCLSIRKANNSNLADVSSSIKKAIVGLNTHKNDKL